MTVFPWDSAVCTAPSRGRTEINSPPISSTALVTSSFSFSTLRELRITPENLAYPRLPKFCTALAILEAAYNAGGHDQHMIRIPAPDRHGKPAAYHVAQYVV